MAPRRRKAGRIAHVVVVVNEAQIKLGLRAELQRLERGEVGVVGARLRYRDVKELDRPSDAGNGRIGDLDHDPRILRLH